MCLGRTSRLGRILSSDFPFCKQNSSIFVHILTSTNCSVVQNHNKSPQYRHWQFYLLLHRAQHSSHLFICHSCCPTSKGMEDVLTMSFTGMWQAIHNSEGFGVLNAEAADTTKSVSTFPTISLLIPWLCRYWSDLLWLCMTASAYEVVNKARRALLLQKRRSIENVSPTNYTRTQRELYIAQGIVGVSDWCGFPIVISWWVGHGWVWSESGSRGPLSRTLPKASKVYRI